MMVPEAAIHSVPEDSINNLTGAKLKQHPKDYQQHPMGTLESFKLNLEISLQVLTSLGDLKTAVSERKTYGMQ